MTKKDYIKFANMVVDLTRNNQESFTRNNLINRLIDIFSNVYYALATTLIIAILIIAVYNYSISTQKQSFSKRFFKMTLISLSVALVTFIIGYLIRIYFGIEI